MSRHECEREIGQRAAAVELPVRWSLHAIERYNQRMRTSADERLTAPRRKLQMAATNVDIGETFTAKTGLATYVCCRQSDAIEIVTVY